MKSYRIILAAFIFTLLSSGLKAQVFVGGSFGLGLHGGKYDNGTEVNDKPSVLDLNLSPMIGKYTSEKVAAGIALNLDYSRRNNNTDVTDLDMTSSYGVTPFLRYHALSAGKFSVFGQANLGFLYSSSKTKHGAITTDGPKVTELSFYIFPGLSYDVNEKLSLETYINVFDLGYSHRTTVEGDNKTIDSGFSIGGGIDNIVNIGNINIGAIYKF